MPDTVLLIVVIEIDIPAFKISIGQQGRKKFITINQSGVSTLVSQNELLK